MHVITTADELNDFVEYTLRQGAFVFDVETTGVFRRVPVVNDVSWISLATEGRTVVVPMGHPNGNFLRSKAYRRKNKETGGWDSFPAVFSPPPTQLTQREVFDILWPLFFSPDIIKIAHNATFDFLSIAKYYGRYPCAPYGDTLVAAWLLDENRQLGLKPLVNIRYGLDYDKKGTGKCVEIHPLATVARYAWLDARMTWLLWKYLRPQISRDSRLEEVWELEMDVLETLLHMQSHGAPVDVESMEELRKELRARLVDVEGRVYKRAGTVFNLGSVPQKQCVLYGSDGEGLDPKKLTPGGLKKQRSGSALTLSDYSTDDEALKSHKGNPLVDSILEYQEIAKIKQTYLDGYLGTDEKPSIIFNGRVYPTFAQYGTVTGRFSCRAPNLQNIPARGDIGKKIRDFFIAPPGNVLLVADYGQIELRILAHYCRDGKLYEGFMNGIDAHTATAAAIFGVAPEDVTKEQRGIAKPMAFAIMYEAQEDRVASMLDKPVKYARHILDLHRKEFPEVYEFKANLLKVATGREDPHIRTLLGRYRRLPDLRSANFGRKSAAQRQLTNSVCQGGNADLIKVAMVRVMKNRPDWFHLLLTVHDELICTVPRDKAQEGAKFLEWAMVGEGIQELIRVPIITDVKVCDRWSEGK
jgi:DNA polymerase I-like protein with 3'-5' exonuclease and polymerase domains